MKNLFIILLCLLCGSAQAKPARLSGTVSGNEGKSLQIMQVGAVDSKIISRAKIVKGKFQFDIPIDKPGFYKLWFPPMSRFDIYIAPDANMSVELSETPVFGSDYASANQMIVDGQIKFNAVRPDIFKDILYDAQRSKDYCDLFCDMEREIKKSEMSSTEKQVVTGYLQGTLIEKLFHRIMDSKVSGNSKLKIEIKPDYNAPIKDIKFNKNVVEHENWFYSMEEYIYSRMDKGAMKIKDPVFWLNDAVKLLNDPTVKETFILSSLRKDASRGHIYRIDERIDAVKENIKSEEGKKELEKLKPMIDKHKAYFKNGNTGTYVGDYSFKDKDGKEVFLRDFKGKHIFIDVWGTSCSPCIGEMPYIKKIEHEFEGKPITWISLSVDGNFDGWHRFLTNKNMEGVQLISTNARRDPFFSCVGLTGIPRFIIIDDECKVVDPLSYRPSNPILKLQLEKLLK